MRWRLLFEPGRRRPVEVRNHVVMASMTSRGAKGRWASAPVATRALACALGASLILHLVEAVTSERVMPLAMTGIGIETTRQSADELAITTAGHRLRRRQRLRRCNVHG